MGRLLLLVAIVAALGILVGGGAAYGWSGGGNNNGWSNKQVRGCPDGYVLVSDIPGSYVDLNGDGYICAKTSGNSGPNYIDNISNH
jgi:hypothetical protein